MNLLIIIGLSLSVCNVILLFWFIHDTKYEEWLIKQLEKKEDNLKNARMFIDELRELYQKTDKERYRLSVELTKLLEPDLKDNDRQE